MEIIADVLSAKTKESGWSQGRGRRRRGHPTLVAVSVDILVFSCANCLCIGFAGF